MKIPVACWSTHPAIIDDRAFFGTHPRRRFRARKFSPNELGYHDNFILFGPGERGEIGEINLVVLKRIRGGRIRYNFVRFADAPLNTDKKIKAFLRSRGIIFPRHDRKGKLL